MNNFCSRLVLKRSFRVGSIQPLVFQSTGARSKPTAENPKKLPVLQSNSFVQNIFRGIVDPTQVAPYPNTLSEEEKETLNLLLPIAERVLAEQNDALENDVLEYVPEHTLNALKEVGGYGLQVPEEYGGAGLNSTQYGRLTEVLGANDLALGVFLTGHQGIGYKGILVVGNDEQKEKYLPPLASGEKMAAFALTEPASGSDASSISTRAELSSDGRFWVMNGSKIWITGGGLADIFTVFAKTPIKDEKTGATKDKITAFIVEREFGGVTNGPPEKKMGIRCSNTAEVYFDNTHIPVENVLGGVGNGFKVAMAILNNGRFGMGTSLSGTMRYVITKTTEHVTSRSQFGSKLESYGTIQEKLARMSMYHYANESMAYMVSGTMDSGYQDYHLEAAVSKIFSSEAAWFITDEAIQILGGMGYMRDCGLEKLMRDLRIFRIFEGTNDILRLFIALTGMQYAGEHLKELQKAVKACLKGAWFGKDSVSNFEMLMEEASKRTKGSIGLTATNLFSEKVHHNLSSSATVLCQDVGAFGTAVEKILIKHGKDVVNQQFLLKRVADAAIDIYVTTCMLSRCSQSLEQGLPSAHHEEMMTLLWCSEAHTRVNQNLDMLKNPIALNNFSLMAKISEGVCSKVQAVQANPLGF